MNLRTIPHLAEAFSVAVGLSDHTMGIATPVAAVALGASLIEKHFTLARSDGGADAAFSLEPLELKSMVEAVRTAEEAVGSVQYGITAEAEKSRRFRRSLFVVEDVEAGESFTTRNVRSIRPFHGLHPRFYEDVLTCRAARRIERGEPLNWEMIARKERLQ
jgi:N-acetylneuraminate synthase